MREKIPFDEGKFSFIKVFQIINEEEIVELKHCPNEIIDLGSDYQ